MRLRRPFRPVKPWDGLVPWGRRFDQRGRRDAEIKERFRAFSTEQAQLKTESNCAQVSEIIP